MKTCFALILFVSIPTLAQLYDEPNTRSQADNYNDYRNRGNGDVPSLEYEMRNRNQDLRESDRRTRVHDNTTPHHHNIDQFEKFKESLEDN